MRYIATSAKPSSALNTAPISDFFGPAAQNVTSTRYDIFTCAKKKLDTNPTPGASPQNVPLLADRRVPAPLARSLLFGSRIFLRRVTVLCTGANSPRKIQFLVHGATLRGREMRRCRHPTTGPDRRPRAEGQSIQCELLAGT